MGYGGGKVAENLELHHGTHELAHIFFLYKQSMFEYGSSRGHNVEKILAENINTDPQQMSLQFV